jgi:cobalt-zinc-cadmium efflux system protein
VSNPLVRSSATRNQHRLLIALGLAAVYMVAEFVGGLLTGSLALLADAGHMLSDVFALAMSAAAIQIARLPATPKRTYGYQRTEILAALGHGILLVCISVYIFTEAYHRARAPVAVQGAPMLVIASGGLLINLASLLILRAGKTENLNVRGAWLHVMSDALGSLGAIVAAALIWSFGWTWADSVASVVIGLMVIYSSASLLREALAVLMEGAPAHIDVEEVRRALTEHRAVLGVHDLHIWTVGSGMVSLSGHIVAEQGFENGPVLKEIGELLLTRFGIAHTTIQVEPEHFEDSGDSSCD